MLACSDQQFSVSNFLQSRSGANFSRWQSSSQTSRSSLQEARGATSVTFVSPALRTWKDIFKIVAAANNIYKILCRNEKDVDASIIIQHIPNPQIRQLRDGSQRKHARASNVQVLQVGWQIFLKHF